MTFLLSMLFLALCAGALGLIIGLAHGIEVERKRIGYVRIPADAGQCSGTDSGDGLDSDGAA